MTSIFQKAIKWISTTSTFQPARSVALTLSLLTCLGAMWSAGRAGLARLYVEKGVASGSLTETSRAVDLRPFDPQAHYARATLLLNAGELEEAIKEFERAASLCPKDYLFWLELGRARDQNGDGALARAAFKQAVSLAPYYAQPRWQLGNHWLRAGQFDEAFAEFRRAAASDPSLLPAVIDLAWSSFDGDAATIEQSIQPQTSAARIMLARFFIKHGKTTEAMSLFRAAANPTEPERRDVLGDLLDAKNFVEAYEVWASASESPRAGDSDHGRGSANLTDGSFESGRISNQPGFGWQMTHDLQGVRVAFDTKAPRAGSRSLLVQFNVADGSLPAVISQLALVEKKTSYRLTFAVRTQNVLASEGMPVVTVSDANNGGQDLGQSESISQGTTGWQDYAVEFTTGNKTSAVRIALRRQNCAYANCLLKGQVWVDDFSLRKF